MTVPRPSKPVVLVAACALVDADGRVLIAQRPAGKALAGLWEFPGGKVETGETFHLLMPLYVCRRFDGTAAGREGQAIKWVRPRALRDYPMPPADEPLIAHLIELL